METSILITGGSSGLGAALAQSYAAPDVTLFLSGRDAARLEGVAARCRAKGACVEATIVDVTDGAAMASWIDQCDQTAPLNLVIANAGISAGTGGGGETPAQTKAVMETNVQGVFNTIHPALALMKPRGRGQIAIMASLASFRGLAGAPAYCASKAAVRVYGEALRDELAPQGIKINVICPGFVKTPMTGQNGFPMPFLMEADKAARIMKRGLEKNKARIVFPWRLAALVWLMSALSPNLADGLFRRLPRKRGVESLG
ncbi:MAG: SDR family NAD(P)-dependent oxidoreductase [Bdellovibrionales bacterium]|jgi:short-subunit dehydrogenase